MQEENEYEEDEKEEGFENSRQPRSNRSSERRKPAASAKELFGNELIVRAQNSNPKLRENLTGTILVNVAPEAAQKGGAKYLFDWSATAPLSGPTEVSNADCVMSLSEEVLLGIHTGALNPQVAMLSDKIQVSGKLSLAIYFFNLIVPHSSLNR